LAINKQLIIQPKVAKNHLAKFVKNLEDEGIRTVFADPKSLGKTKMQTVFPSQNADYVILDKPIIKKLKERRLEESLRSHQIKTLKMFLILQKKD